MRYSLKYIKYFDSLLYFRTLFKRNIFKLLNIKFVMKKNVEYVTPVTEVLEFKYEGIVCGSVDASIRGAKFDDSYDDQSWD